MQTVQQMIVQAAVAQGVDPNLALAVAQQESGFNQSAIGTSGEVGVFQLMPTTAQQLGVNPSDLQQNINGGVTYLKQQLDTFGGDPAFAAAAYNSGPNGNFDSAQVTNYVNSVMRIYNKNAGSDVASQVAPAPSAVAVVDNSMGLDSSVLGGIPGWVPAAIGLVIVFMMGRK